MQTRLQKLMRMAFALCMAAVMFFSVVADVQAASYKKSFTKTVTVEAWKECILTVNSKKDAKVTMTVSTTSKKKDLKIQASQSGKGGGVVDLSPSKKKAKTVLKLKKGDNVIYVSNIASGKVKVKIKFSSKAKVLKFKKKEVVEDVG